MERTIEKPSVKKTDYKPMTYYDYSLLFITLVLICVGLIMVYSTSSYFAIKQKFGSANYFFNRQLIAAVVGLAGMILVSKFDYHWFTKPFGKKVKFRLIQLAYLVCVGLQLYAMLFGKEVKGAKRWIELPIIGSFQPSELTKICVILFAAYMINAAPKRLDNFFGFIWVVFYLSPLIALVALENLSTAIIICGIVFVLCFVVTRKKSIYFWIMLGGIGALFAIIKFGKGFRGNRMDAFFHVETHPDAYQIRQGLYAIASGGLFGKGLGNSTQKLGYIPESHNDMIFSIICEELGMLGGLIVILLFVLLLYRLYVIACNAKDLFGSLICIGIMVHIGMQVVMNIAVVTHTMPATGIPLPLISYGGTSLVVLMLELGLALSVSGRIEYER